jgi:lysophospholipid acyltransferase (LPLAT)-like uncharacterized protein
MNIAKSKIVHQMGLKLLGTFVNVLCKTLRVKKDNFQQLEKFLKNRDKCVVGFWHGTMLYPWYLLRGNSFSALVSKSKDGDLLNTVLNKWNYNVIRGSSRDGGKAALELMLDAVNKNHSIAITPDGPTGPPFEMKAGGVIVAQRSNVPLFLIGVKYKNSVKLNSWDKFEIPKPFTEVYCTCSELIKIPPDSDREAVSEQIKKCEDLLNSLQKEAGKFA